LSDTIIDALTLEGLREFLLQAGYRVETATDPTGAALLRSATGGLAFDVRLGNRLADTQDGVARHADATLQVALMVQGEMPRDVVDGWNASRRFGRLRLDCGLLIFDMDVSVAGGVTPAHLRASIEIWDRLVQELIVHLRTELARLAPGATPPAAAAAA